MRYHTNVLRRDITADHRKNIFLVAKHEHFKSIDVPVTNPSDNLFVLNFMLIHRLEYITGRIH